MRALYSLAGDVLLRVLVDPAAVGFRVEPNHRVLVATSGGILPSPRDVIERRLGHD